MTSPGDHPREGEALTAKVTSPEALPQISNAALIANIHQELVRMHVALDKLFAASPQVPNNSGIDYDAADNWC